MPTYTCPICEFTTTNPATAADHLGEAHTFPLSSVTTEKIHQFLKDGKLISPTGLLADHLTQLLQNNDSAE